MLRPADKMLEEWAAWRLHVDFYSGTGSSSLARFLEPGRRGFPCCKPLWTGVIRSECVQLDGRLSEAMTEKKIIILIMIYGLTAGSFRRVMAGRECVCSDRTIRRIKEKARFIAEQLMVQRTLIAD